MCRICMGIVGVVIAFSFVGCGDEPEEGSKAYKGSESPEIAKLRDAMTENMKSGKYSERPTEAKQSATKPEDKKKD